MNAAAAVLLGGIILLGAIACRAEVGGPDRSLSPPFRNIHAIREKGYNLAQATPRYYDQQLLNYRLTEFCAAVPAVPKGLVESIDKAFEQDAALRSIWEWVHIVANARRRCGDA